MKSMNDTYTLNNGMQIPCIGFGTYKAADGNDVTILKNAIEAGYRYFDTASFYFTEEALGQAIRESGIPREEFFIVSKMWKSEMGYENAKQALQNSLDRLGMEYIDIYLIHWPRSKPDADWKTECVETWKAMEEGYEAGKIKGLGLSNFLPHHTEVILQNCKVKPVVDQLELHPGYMQLEAIRYCKEHDILVQAWSPLGRLRVMENKLLIELAEKYNVSKAQICLRFLHQLDIILIPKSSTPERMKENTNIFDFEISQEDMYRLLTMPQCGWSGEHPDYELAEKVYL